MLCVLRICRETPPRLWSCCVIIFAFEVRERSPQFLLRVLCIIGCPVQLIEEVFLRCVDTRLPRFDALAYVLPHIDALTHVVIRVSSAFIFQTFSEVCHCHLLKVCWIFVKGTYLKSLLKVYYPCVFAESKRSSSKSLLNLRKAYMFKSLLKVFYRSVFNESSKAFIFQKFAESLHPE